MWSVPAWRTAWVAFGLGAVALLALCMGTVETTIDTWINDTTFNHGFLIIPISGYLVWQRRGELARMSPEPSALALVPLALAAFGWLLGAAASVNPVQQFGLLGMLWSLFAAVFGWRIVRYLAFPLAFTAFAVPFGTFLVQPLQHFTAAFAIKGIELLGIPVYSEGFLISIPNGNFEVAEACAGIRFLIATLALGFLFAELTSRSLVRKAVFLSLCVVVPLIANGLRAFGIVLIGYLSDMTMAVGFDHIVYGWLLFAIITVILLAVGMAFRDRDLAEIPPAPPTSVRRTPTSRGRIVALAAGAVALAAAFPAYGKLVLDRVPPLAQIALTGPEIGGGWRPIERANHMWRPYFPGADATAMHGYAKNGRAVWLFIAYYRYQRSGAEVVSALNKLADGRTWRPVSDSAAAAPIDRRTTRVHQVRLARGPSELTVWGWNWIGGQFTADAYFSKILQVKAKLLDEPLAAAYVAIAVDEDPVGAPASAILRDFLANMEPLGPLLSRAVPR
jgi:exosortase A